METGKSHRRRARTFVHEQAVQLHQQRLRARPLPAVERGFLRRDANTTRVRRIRSCRRSRLRGTGGGLRAAYEQPTPVAKGAVK